VEKDHERSREEEDRLQEEVKHLSFKI